MDFVGVGFARDIEQVCDVVSAFVSGTGAVRAAYGTPAKG